MRASLVDILSLSQDHAYQLIFTCTRQLGVQLRSAYGDHSVSVVTWPLIHSLELFTSTLSSVISDTLAPLLYPVIHVALGVVQYLHSPMYIPTRLHIVRMLIPVAMETGTYIPLVSILVEVSNCCCIFKYISSQVLLIGLHSVSIMLADFGRAMRSAWIKGWNSW